MEPVLRGLSVYLFLVVIFRVTGHRSIGQITTFDFVLLLIVAETTQQALLGDDFSLTNAFLLVSTLVLFNLAASLLKRSSRRLDRLLEGVPLVVVEHGELLAERMRRSHLDEDDILSAARATHGLERMDQVRYAVLERDGGISIVPERARLT